MKDADLRPGELEETFSTQRFFPKAALRDFYRSRSPNLTENKFRRILYALEKRELIHKVDRGIYVLGKDQPDNRSSVILIPAFSDQIQGLSRLIKENLPFLDFLVWETRILFEFMLHLPGQNQIILETESNRGVGF